MAGIVPRDLTNREIHCCLRWDALRPCTDLLAEFRGYLVSRWLFLRLLGVVYLIAFAFLALQITGLVGEHGILPAGQFLEWARSIYGPGQSPLGGAHERPIPLSLLG